MDTKRYAKYISVSIFLFVWLTLAACGGKGPGSPTFYLPPTPVSSALAATSQPAPDLSAPNPTPTSPCTDNLTYLQDLTIPDDTVLAPEAAIDKQWLVQNSGTCNWDERYRLRLLSGDALGAPIEQALYPARAGAQVVLRLVFTAPSEPGTYRSAWQAYDPQGQAFGDPVFIEIVVQ